MIEEEVFLDSIMDTLVMQSAIDFMTSKGDLLSIIANF